MAAVVGPAKLWSQTVFSFRSLPGSGLPLASPFPGQDLADLLGPEVAPALKSDYLDWLGLLGGQKKRADWRVWDPSRQQETLGLVGTSFSLHPLLEL